MTFPLRDFSKSVRATTTHVQYTKLAWHQTVKETQLCTTDNYGQLEKFYNNKSTNVRNNQEGSFKAPLAIQQILSTQEGFMPITDRESEFNPSSVVIPRPRPTVTRDYVPHTPAPPRLEIPRAQMMRRPLDPRLVRSRQIRNAPTSRRVTIPPPHSHQHTLGSSSKGRQDAHSFTVEAPHALVLVLRLRRESVHVPGDNVPRAPAAGGVHLCPRATYAAARDGARGDVACAAASGRVLIQGGKGKGIYKSAFPPIVEVEDARGDRDQRPRAL